MDKEKFTPGPWFANTNNLLVYFKNKETNDEPNVLDDERVGNTQAVANVKLMAVAPDMYEILNNILTKWHSKLSNMKKKEPEYLEKIRKINKAIQ